MARGGSSVGAWWLLGRRMVAEVLQRRRVVAAVLQAGGAGLRWGASVRRRRMEISWRLGCWWRSSGRRHGLRGGGEPFGRGGGVPRLPLSLAGGCEGAVRLA